MTAARISGYIVVDLGASGAYRGIDRSPWQLIDERYYAGELPEEIRRSYEQIRSEHSRGFWWPVARTIETAESLFAYTVLSGGAVELLAVSSRYLDGLSSAGHCMPQVLTPIGVDVVSVGEWSLLRAMQESKGFPKRELEPYLNDYGLLASEESVALVEELYRRWTNTGVLEPIAEEGTGLPVEPVRIGVWNAAGSTRCATTTRDARGG